MNGMTTAMVAGDPGAWGNDRIAFEFLLRVDNIGSLEIPEVPGIIAPPHEKNAPPRVQNIRRRNVDLIARMEGDRIVRVIPPANQPPREIAPEIAPPPANGELMLWENLPHAEVPEELVRFFLSPQMPLRSPSTEWGRSTYVAYV
ncbi:hypothetical protein DAPPUDRAFT_110853 [Daphnia pulex]|uniref:Uncharacterized protein n=1 Tax=Daphnia pulex TaxID=6669 RepID=E9H7C6_DAPPU|nr:hypothetical protein DAPPUDRAFT_110853 [Daphnia pulex]|eukprot:EFX72389.1 hypothetical protein DAPPUDRAFT_110853 [Daphnia pulex]